MNEQERNQYRNFAHEVIIKLYDAKAVEALKLLRQHCDRALEELGKEQ